MKVAVRQSLAVMFIPVTALFLLGCPKKPPKPTPAPKVSQSVMTTKSTPRPTLPPDTGAGAGIADESSRMSALRGDDIPITEMPSLEFVEPGPEDRETLRNIYFDFDKSSIKPEFQPVLEKISQWLMDRSDKQLLIEGHCDERGTSEYNLALGERRALSVRRYLVGLGISPNRLHTVTYGEDKPDDPGHNEEAWARNRRAHFKVSAN